MAEDEEAGARPDEQEKAAQPTKKHRAKGRSAGSKPESETDLAGETADASSEEEASAPLTDIAGSEAKTEVEEPPRSVTASPETPAESKPKSLIHLLRFERRVGKRRR